MLFFLKPKGKVYFSANKTENLKFGYFSISSHFADIRLRVDLVRASSAGSSFPI